MRESFQDFCYAFKGTLNTFLSQDTSAIGQMVTRKSAIGQMVTRKYPMVALIALGNTLSLQKMTALMLLSFQA